MTIHFFILFLFFICGRVYGEVLNADWSCFQYGDELNTVRSEDLIRNLKISSYFDNVKGVFRTGVIGELNSLSVGNQTIPRKLFVNGNSRTVDSLVVDLSFLHLHALANVQSYFGKLDNFRNNHPTLFLSQWEGEESFPTIKKIEKIHGLVVRKSMLEYQVRSMESKMVFIRNKTEQEATLLNKKLSQILRIKEKVHNTIIQSIALHKQNIHKVFEQRINYTKISIEKNFERIIEKEILSMEQLNLDRIEVLKNSTQMIEALADFRIQEESRLFREEESSIFTMLSSKSSIQKEKIESLIRGILDTTGQIFVDLLSSPEMLWMLICLVLAFIIIHTLFVEAFSSLSYLISKSRRLSLSNSRTYESSSGRFHTPRVRSKYLESFRVAFENIYLEDVDLITLQNVFVNLSIAIDTGGLMPNVLLCANSGMGKSTIVKTLISSLSIDATVLSANDLILRKCSGCLKVREIVYQATVKRKPFVFIIEDVETLVGNYHESENNSRNAIKKSLFHIILDCINDQSNKYISFVFTTTTSLDYIERALLDR